MTPSEITKLRAALSRMPRGPYEYSLNYDNVYSVPTGARGIEILAEVSRDKGEYFALLSPENVAWLLDKAEAYDKMMEDDLK